MTVTGPHPNDMTFWPAIACQRGHTTHQTRTALIDLTRQHGYGDQAQVPAWLAPAPFRMELYPPDVYPVDGGPYCPAHDAVSETIVSHLIWEPRETILALHALATAQRGQEVWDLGCQLGWYSLLGAAYGLSVWAVDADDVNLSVLNASAWRNGWAQRIATTLHRFGAQAITAELPREGVRFVKIDLEGAEEHAVEMLRPALGEGLVDHLLIEVSPVFKPGDHYRVLVDEILRYGYDAFLLPPKQHPPVDLSDPAAVLVPLVDTSVIPSWHQEDVWFVRRGVTW